MSSATVTSKGQLTIPADIRAEFGIEPGHRIVFFKQLNGELGVKLMKLKRGSGYAALADYATGRPPTDDEIGDAVAEGAAAKRRRKAGA